MDTRPYLLKQVMRDTRTTQVELSRLSGVSQPSISRILSGQIDFSDRQLNRLLSCMGHRLQVTYTVEDPELMHEEYLSWHLHRHIAYTLTRSTLTQHLPTLRQALDLMRRVNADPCRERLLERWDDLLRDGDVGEIKRILTGLDLEAIEMREVSPMIDLLDEGERPALPDRKEHP